MQVLIPNDVPPVPKVVGTVAPLQARKVCGKLFVAVPANGTPVTVNPGVDAAPGAVTAKVVNEPAEHPAQSASQLDPELGSTLIRTKAPGGTVMLAAGAAVPFWIVQVVGVIVSVCPEWFE